jgi:hypothetical protein
MNAVVRAIYQAKIQPPQLMTNYRQQNTVAIKINKMKDTD